MSSRIHRFVRHATSTIRRKLLLVFIPMLVILIALNLYTFSTTTKQITDYGSIIEQYVFLNDTYTSVGDIAASAEKFFSLEDDVFLEQYGADMRTLTSSVDKLNDAVLRTKSKRTVSDYKNIIKTYTEYLDTSIELYKSGDRETWFSHYFESRNVLNLINDYYKTLSLILTTDTQEVFSEISASKNLRYFINIMLILVGGIACLLYIFAYTKKIVRPITELTEFASEFSNSGNDHMVKHVTVKTDDELGILAAAMDKMIVQIQGQMTEIKQNATIYAKLKEMEFRLLQSRIQPHFLFNSLNIIKQMSYLEHAEQTTTLLDAMVSYLRYNLENFDKVVTLKEEMMNMEDYVFIQRNRFGDRIKFILQDDPSAGDALLPCLTLQPLFENSIIHGVHDMIENAIVEMRIIRRQGRIFLYFHDNGKGIDAEKLTEIRTMFREIEVLGEEPSEREVEIGLKNVLFRLIIIFNGDVNFYIDSSGNRGMEMLIDFPFAEKVASDV
jgi:sensor histidine kinase YesM